MRRKTAKTVAVFILEDALPVQSDNASLKLFVWCKDGTNNMTSNKRRFFGDKIQDGGPAGTCKIVFL